MRENDTPGVESHTIGFLDVSAYNETVIPSVEFVEAHDNDDKVPTGRSVLIRKDEWKGQSAYVASNAVVAFFGELVAQFGSDPKLQALMEHYGIEYKEKTE
jgi:hypothetical protein